MQPLSEPGYPKRPLLAVIYLPIGLGAAAFATRILYEETLLSWRNGPQMIFFSLGHSLFGVLLLLSFLGANLILLITWIRLLRWRSMEGHQRKRLLTVGVMFSIVTLPVYVPESVLLRGVFAMWGPGPNAPAHFEAAAGRGDMSMVKYLVSAGMPMKASGVGGTHALDIAARKGQTEMVEYLLQQGADPDRRADWLQRTPLMDAIERDFPDVVRALLRGGARLDLIDEKGETALALAIRLNRTEIEEILRSAKREQ